jgi:hypothetical protein
MTPNDAVKIINDYGKVMEQTSAMVFAAPLSILPHSKDDIKEAIKMMIALSKPNDDIQYLISGYVDLAKYIDDNKVGIAMQYQDILEKDKGRGEFKNQSENQESYSEFIKIIKENPEESERLLKELDDTLNFLEQKNKGSNLI